MMAVCRGVALPACLGLLFLPGLDGARFFAYDYSRHGQDWAMGLCASRSRQSPVDFPVEAIQAAASGGQDIPKLPYRYNLVETPFEMQNNGRTFSADLSARGYGGLAHEDAWYDLMNVNVHAVSEHTWAGQHEPVELHLVHKRYDGDALLIVAVPLVSPSGTALLQRTSGRRLGSSVNRSRAFLHRQEQSAYQPPPEGDAGFSDVVQSFLRVALPAAHGTVQVPAEEAHPLDLNKLMEGGSFLEYAGSMTAPPCAEIVTWLVRSQPILASDMQVRMFVDGVYATTGGSGNYRSVMPWNGRSLLIRNAVFEAAPLPPAGADAPVEAAGSGSATTRSPSAKAETIANEALRLARNATEYVATLESSLKEEASAEASAGVLPCSTTMVFQGVVPEAVAQAQQEIFRAANASAMEAARAAVEHVQRHLLSTTLSPS